MPNQRFVSDELALSLRPWGVTRMSGFMPSESVSVSVVGVDPATQLAVYSSDDGSSGLYHTLGGATRGRLTETAPPDGKVPRPPDRDHADDF